LRDGLPLIDGVKVSVGVIVVTIELGESDLAVGVDVNVGCILSDGLYDGIMLPEGIDDNVGTSDGATELNVGKLLKDGISVFVWDKLGVREVSCMLGDADMNDGVSLLVGALL